MSPRSSNIDNGTGATNDLSTSLEFSFGHGGGGHPNDVDNDLDPSNNFGCSGNFSCFMTTLKPQIAATFKLSNVTNAHRHLSRKRRIQGTFVCLPACS